MAGRMLLEVGWVDLCALTMRPWLHKLTDCSLVFTYNVYTTYWFHFNNILIWLATNEWPFFLPHPTHFLSDLIRNTIMPFQNQNISSNLRSLWSLHVRQTSSFSQLTPGASRTQLSKRLFISHTAVVVWNTAAKCYQQNIISFIFFHIHFSHVLIFTLCLW